MPCAEFEQFRLEVLRDPSLQKMLRYIDSRDEFIPRVVEMGAGLGFTFTIHDVKDAMRAGLSDWLMRWV